MDVPFAAFIAVSSAALLSGGCKQAPTSRPQAEPAAATEPEPDPVKQRAPDDERGVNDGRVRVQLSGGNWYWMSHYVDIPMLGFVSNDAPGLAFAVPVGVQVELTLTCEVYGCGLAIPAVGASAQSAPGESATVEFTAPTTAQTLELRCTSRCGPDPERMHASVAVLDPQRFAEEVAAQRLPRRASESLAGYGRRLSQELHCGACHTVDGNPGVGPTWLGLWDSTRRFSDGTQLRVAGEAGRAYLREAILEPRARFVEGWGPGMNVMVDYRANGDILDEHVPGLIAYIESLHQRDRTRPEPPRLVCVPSHT